MSTEITVDFVSDVVCPWCAIGLAALDQAIANLAGEVTVKLNFMPFELNPNMPASGENAVEHIMRKYGSSRSQILNNQQGLRARGEEVGFRFDLVKRTHFYNTFDAHRLLFWAALEGRQVELKHALLGAYFTDGRSLADGETLARIAGSAGLDPVKALEVLSKQHYSDEVRGLQRLYMGMGINAVPAVIINGTSLISGAQSVEYYQRALSKVARDATV
ncbi:MAG: 2-hydroxychromene-2-carboxylate isomerase/DsbA-like thioredoxin domain [Pseudomonas sp.]|nr:2-hydroxychromene-2-carboxylate isomerase/DsbA-like thioredoxin domain [Pseudomonas sp.]